jgi:hypothetical protein
MLEECIESIYFIPFSRLRLTPGCPKCLRDEGRPCHCADSQKNPGLPSQPVVKDSESRGAVQVSVGLISFRHRQRS